MAVSRSLLTQDTLVDMIANELSKRLRKSTIGCTKDLIGRGIIVDCITENGPIPGALWTFLTELKTRKGKSYDFQFTETAVAKEKA